MKSDEEPDRWRVAQEKAREVAGALFGILNLIAALAAPRVLARLKDHELEQMTRERVLEFFDRHLASIDSPDTGLRASDPLVAAATHARRMRALLESSTPRKQANMRGSGSRAC
jgi:hypothetical protein